MVVIQNSFELGLLTGGYNSTYVINPDEFHNFQNQILQGQKLGHADRSATAHTLDTTGYSTYTTGTYNTGQTYYSNGEYSSYSLGAWERSWNGLLIQSTELENQLINGQKVTGVFLQNGEFVQGKILERNGVWQFIAGQYQLTMMGDWMFIEGFVDNGVFVEGTWNHGFFTPTQETILPFVTSSWDGFNEGNMDAMTGHVIHIMDDQISHMSDKDVGSGEA